jgi:hypothetical protein
MNAAIAWPLMLLFAAHLAGFTVLGLKRREWYYLALIVTFSLLTTAFALAVFAPELQILGVEGHRAARYAAWPAAALSLTWTAVRVAARRRR